jgi:serine phosphatase RsbU (regulator of sigma subunit)
MVAKHPVLVAYQQDFLSQWYQFVLFDQAGIILDSNNTFADIRDFYGKSVYMLNVFLESLQPVIESLEDSQNELFFPRMEISLGEREGVFDYTIKRIKAIGEVFFIWVVEDNTLHNKYLSLVQQERNDTYIQNELLQLKTQNQILQEEVEKQTADIQTQKSLIEKQKEDILDSIRYARRIQNAILPTTRLLSNVSFETLIFSQPKDIVSGDFYWAVQIDRVSILCIADCTGHGVPGAFMSIVGQNMLRTAVMEMKMDTPKKILEALDRQMLQLFENDDRVHDGMDIAVLVVDNQAQTISFGGAKRPLYFVRDGVFQEIKGAPYAIGGHHITHGKSFTDFALQIHPQDIFYLFSDGYADQFGGESNRKFMTKNFKNLLLQICHFPIEVQKNILSETLLSWKGKREQTDDILIMGLKFS